VAGVEKVVVNGLLTVDMHLNQNALLALVPFNFFPEGKLFLLPYE